MRTGATDNFDDFAADYRHIHNRNIQVLGGDSYYFARAKVRHVRDRELDPVLNILDIGCGDGTTAFCMAALFPGCLITGIDVSAESIDMAIKKEIQGAVFSTYNGLAVPFTDGCFDLVFIAGVLHHVDEVVQTSILQEAFRVLKKQGRIYIFEHNPYNPATRYLVKTCVFDRHASLLKSGAVKKLLLSAGFSSMQNRYITFFPQNRFFSRFHPVEKIFGWCAFGAQFFVAAVK